MKDSNLIRRGDVAESLQRIRFFAVADRQSPKWMDKLNVELANIPAVDAVEVVRCRECKFFDAGQNDAEAWEWCKIWERDCESECYCRYGQRREDGDA